MSAGIVGSPRWSPDGTQIAFDARVEGNPDIWVVSSQGGAPRRLTSESAEDVVPDWSPDGNWVYFTSGSYRPPGDLEGSRHWRHGAADHARRRFQRAASANASVYYLKSREQGELRRCPAAGGKEEPIDPEFKSRNFVVLSDGIYGLDGGEASQPGVLPRPMFGLAERDSTGSERDDGRISDSRRHGPLQPTASNCHPTGNGSTTPRQMNGAATSWSSRTSRLAHDALVDHDG